MRPRRPDWRRPPPEPSLPFTERPTPGRLHMPACALWQRRHGPHAVPCPSQHVCIERRPWPGLPHNARPVRPCAHCTPRAHIPVVPPPSASPTLYRPHRTVPVVPPHSKRTAGPPHLVDEVRVLQELQLGVVPQHRRVRAVRQLAQVRRQPGRRAQVPLVQHHERQLHKPRRRRPVGLWGVVCAGAALLGRQGQRRCPGHGDDDFVLWDAGGGHEAAHAAKGGRRDVAPRDAGLAGPLEEAERAAILKAGRRGLLLLRLWLLPRGRGRGEATVAS